MLSRLKGFLESLGIGLAVMVLGINVTVVLMTLVLNGSIPLNGYVWSLYLVFGPTFFGIVNTVPLVILHWLSLRVLRKVQVRRSIVVSAMSGGFIMVLVTVLWLIWSPYDWMVGGFPQVIAGLLYGAIAGVREGRTQGR